MGWSSRVSYRGLHSDLPETVPSAGRERKGYEGGTEGADEASDHKRVIESMEFAGCYCDGKIRLSVNYKWLNMTRNEPFSYSEL